MSAPLEVVSVNLSPGKGTAKKPVPRAEVGPQGLAGDGHAGPWHRQVSLLSLETIARFNAAHGTRIGPGEFAENLTLRGTDLSGVAVLDRLRFGPVELEVSQIGKACHGEGCAVFQRVGECAMPKEGIFARVVEGGALQPGDRGEHLPRALKIHVITLSDRAARGDYPDRSGPRLRQLLEAFFAGKRWHPAFASAVLPDDAVRLREALEQAIRGGADLIFTTGGTGVGPRDITPEAVLAVAGKQVPGIMENIRAKFGAAKPAALLSRSVAAVAGTTQIYALPGSVRAVEEYLGEILKTMEHMIFMLHALDVH
ncbi:MAG: molybdenum cofactor synthesis protein [Elusimicrobia bacterium]|nr:molybdenum cofactor synthesis protein [Elusimicrobiota bacterium]